MKDPLAAERAELVRMIERLEAVVERLQGVNARVSADLAAKFEQPGAQLERARSPSEWRQAQDLWFTVLKAVAAEAVRWMLETLICINSAAVARRGTYAGWRFDQNASRIRGSQAKGVGETRRHLVISTIARRVGKAGAVYQAAARHRAWIGHPKRRNVRRSACR